MKRRTYIFIALGALALWALVHLFRQEASRGPQIGSFAPDFSLSDLQGQSVSLQSLRGKAVLLNFWASWCGPCQHEMPSLETLYQKYKDRGFVVLGVSLDEDGWAPVKEFLQRVPVSFPIVNDASQSLSENYQTYRVPETFLIDTQGRIVDKIVGPQDYDQAVFYKKVERVLPRASGESATSP